MTIENGYITLASWKAGRDITSTDTADDSFIETLITAASRWADNLTSRRFMPYIDTREFDVPPKGDNELWLDEDLLETLTVTNGDGTALTQTTDYVFQPANHYPKYALVLRASQSLYWSWNSSASHQQVINIAALWGCHKRYGTNAWTTVTTLAEDLDVSETAWDLTSAASLSATGGQLVRVDNELAFTTSTSSNTLTVQGRGANGSTAATHLTGAAVKLWNVEPDVAEAVRLVVESLEKRRFGENMTGTATITAAGVVITPQDIPAAAVAFMAPYAVKVWT